MNRELLKLKKILLKVNTPTRELLVAKALRTILGYDEGMTEEEAYKILGEGIDHEYI